MRVQTEELFLGIFKEEVGRNLLSLKVSIGLSDSSRKVNGEKLNVMGHQRNRKSDNDGHADRKRIGDESADFSESTSLFPDSILHHSRLCDMGQCTYLQQGQGKENLEIHNSLIFPDCSAGSLDIHKPTLRDKYVGCVMINTSNISKPLIPVARRGWEGKKRVKNA